MSKQETLQPTATERPQNWGPRVTALVPSDQMRAWEEVNMVRMEIRGDTKDHSALGFVARINDILSDRSLIGDGYESLLARVIGTAGTSITAEMTGEEENSAFGTYDLLDGQAGARRLNKVSKNIAETSARYLLNKLGSAQAVRDFVLAEKQELDKAGLPEELYGTEERVFFRLMSQSIIMRAKVIEKSGLRYAVADQSVFARAKQVNFANARLTDVWQERQNTALQKQVDESALKIVLDLSERLKSRDLSVLLAKTRLSSSKDAQQLKTIIFSAIVSSCSEAVIADREVFSKIMQESLDHLKAGLSMKEARALSLAFRSAAGKIRFQQEQAKVREAGLSLEYQDKGIIRKRSMIWVRQQAQAIALIPENGIGRHLFSDALKDLSSVAGVVGSHDASTIADRLFSKHSKDPIRLSLMIRSALRAVSFHQAQRPGLTRMNDINAVLVELRRLHQQHSPELYEQRVPVQEHNAMAITRRLKQENRNLAQLLNLGRDKLFLLKRAVSRKVLDPITIALKNPWVWRPATAVLSILGFWQFGEFTGLRHYASQAVALEPTVTAIAEKLGIEINKKPDSVNVFAVSMPEDVSGQGQLSEENPEEILPTEEVKETETPSQEVIVTAVSDTLEDKRMDRIGSENEISQQQNLPTPEPVVIPTPPPAGNEPMKGTVVVYENPHFNEKGMTIPLSQDEKKAFTIIRYALSDQTRFSLTIELQKEGLVNGGDASETDGVFSAPVLATEVGEDGQLVDFMHDGNEENDSFVPAFSGATITEANGAVVQRKHEVFIPVHALQHAGTWTKGHYPWINQDNLAIGDVVSLTVIDKKTGETHFLNFRIMSHWDIKRDSSFASTFSPNPLLEQISGHSIVLQGCKNGGTGKGDMHGWSLVLDSVAQLFSSN